MKIRAFIAIEISENLQKEFSKLQEELKKSNADVKWVEPQNMHLTLKFLGETEENKIEKIKEILNKIASETSPFEITFSKLGAFPKFSSPRVIWIGINEGKKDLENLANKIEKSLTHLGFSEEKRLYSAHLTLGRIKSGKNKEKLIKIIEEKNSFYSLQKLSVQKIVLIQSNLTPSGPIYTKLAEFYFS